MTSLPLQLVCCLMEGFVPWLTETHAHLGPSYARFFSPSVLHVFNLWSHEVAVVSGLYLEATYVNELLTKTLDLVLITLVLLLEI